MTDVTVDEAPDGGLKSQAAAPRRTGPRGSAVPGMGTYSTNGVTTEPRVPEAELEKETTVISTTVTRLLTKTAFIGHLAGGEDG